MATASYYRFESAGKLYVYDFNTNSIISVDRVLFTVLEDYLTGGTDRIFERHRDDFGNEDLLAAVKDIEELKGLHFFRRSSQERVARPYPEGQLQHHLSCKRMQLVLEISQDCNLRCRYCTYSGKYSNQRIHSRKVMSLEMSQKAIDTFHRHSSETEVPSISFYGGEPFRNWDVVKQSIEYIHSFSDWSDRVLLSIDTNGTLVDDTRLNYLIEKRVNLQISLDGPQPIHDASRTSARGEGSWAKVNDLLERIWAKDDNYYRKRVSISCTLTPPYDLAAVQDYFMQPQLQKLMNIRCGFVERTETDLKKLYPEELENSKLKSSAKEMRKTYLNKMMTGRRNDLSPLEENLFNRRSISIMRRPTFEIKGKISANGTCVPGVRKVFVDVNGKYFPCEKCGLSFEIGNVDDDVDISKVRAMIDEFVGHCERLCHDCWAARLCSMCFINGRKDGAMDLEAKRALCNGERGEIGIALEDVVKICDKNPHAFDFIKKMKFS